MKTFVLKFNEFIYPLPLKIRYLEPGTFYNPCLKHYRKSLYFTHYHRPFVIVTAFICSTFSVVFTLNLNVKNKRSMTDQ